MLDYRNILRVASDPHKSMRTMELELRSSHHTIRKVLDAAEKAGISWPLPENVTNEMLIELLFPEEYQKTVLYRPAVALPHLAGNRAGTSQRWTIPRPFRQNGPRHPHHTASRSENGNGAESDPKQSRRRS